MLDATEALFFDSSDEPAIAHERGRGVRMKGIKAEDDHE
jgi:hypothetical protein